VPRRSTSYQTRVLPKAMVTTLRKEIGSRLEFGSALSASSMASQHSEIDARSDPLPPPPPKDVAVQQNRSWLLELHVCFDISVMHYRSVGVTATTTCDSKLGCTHGTKATLGGNFCPQFACVVPPPKLTGTPRRGRRWWRSISGLRRLQCVVGTR
jgi:hypothetical protein